MAQSKEFFIFSALFLFYHSFVIAQDGTTLSSELDSHRTNSPSTENFSGTETIPRSTPWPSIPTTTGFFYTSTIESLPTRPTTTGASNGGGVTDCNTKLTLGNYCVGYLEAEDGQKVMSFFKPDTSIDDLLGMIINGDTVQALLSQCEPGVWCLSNSYHESIYQEMSNFYAAPVCNQALWNCLQSAAQYRETCSDNDELFAFLELISLLCDMNAVGDLQPECYTKTIELLHVLYTDATRGVNIDFSGPLCANYTEKIVKTFLCSVDACGLKQSVFLKEFSALVNIAINSEMVFIKCNMSTLCPDNSTLAPRADFSVNTVPTNMTNSSSAQSIDHTASDKKIMQQELAEENELDKVFDKLEQQIEQEEREKVEGETETDASRTNTNVPSTTIWTGASWDGASTTAGYSDEGNHGELDVSSFNMGGDQTMLFGAITLSTLVLLGLIAIGFMSCRQYRVKRGANYKRGYSQLSDEESRMMNYE